MKLGIDIGAISVKTAILDAEGNILSDSYTRHKGEPISVLTLKIKELFQSVNTNEIEALGITGTGGKVIAKFLGIPFINEVIAQVKATEHLLPGTATIIEIGGEDSKLISLSYDGQRCFISDFSMNTICAAGAGSFLDQQASRMGLSIEEFSEASLKCDHPPRIAGRCSVFAKTDMIHSQQEGSTVSDIIAGLCFAFARNFKSSIGKGKAILSPVSFCGGVAQNKGMIRAFKEVLALSENFIISEHASTMGAIGAALLAKDKADISRLFSFVMEKEMIKHPEPLMVSSVDETNKHKTYPLKQNPESRIQNPESLKQKVWVGIDIGSISTNVIAIDEEKNVVARRYLMTAGRPIEAVVKGLYEIGEELGDVEVVGCGTTGSGRYMSGDFIGSDVVKNEITAQARAAWEIDPGVDTIFEIGGQDSKFISIDNKAIIDFEMNKVCAAGTGSFLEEQAERLNISIKEEFAKEAFSSRTPIPLGERCTVFIESDIVHHQQLGAERRDLVAGLAYSIVHNYLNKVVQDKRIGKNIFFQGGVANNKAVVAAFEAVVGKKITVPENHDVTGAIGVALIAQENYMECIDHVNARIVTDDALQKTQKARIVTDDALQKTQKARIVTDDALQKDINIYENSHRKSRFEGFDLRSRKYTLSSFECKGCPNHCEIKKVGLEDDEPLFYGARCERFEVKKKKKASNLPDLFAEREELLENIYQDTEYRIQNPEYRIQNTEYRIQNPEFRIQNSDYRSPITKPRSPIPEPRTPDVPTIGIPRAVIFYELYPFYKAFFSELGFRVVFSERTNKELIHQGVENAGVDTCFPIKLAYGHILSLLEKGVDYLFLPSIINLKQESPYFSDCYLCPYVQSLPYTAKALLPFSKTKVLTPVVRFNLKSSQIEQDLVDFGETLGKTASKIREAYRVAEKTQDDFRRAITERGKEVLAGLSEEDRAIVIIARPYNGQDPALNLELPKKLRDLDTLAIPMDFLPLDSVDVSSDWPNMYWRLGQRILSAAEIISRDGRLFALYLTNYGCGPDSFICTFFRHKSLGKPHLVIEVDEHSADVGAITRCEAFLDSIAHSKNKIGKERHVKTLSIKKGERKKIYLPFMSDHAFALASAFSACGVQAEVMPPSDEESVFWGRKHTTGRECYPAIITTGDMVRQLKRGDFDPESSCFFMGGSSGPCRFGQYSMLQRLILDDFGYTDVPIYAPNQAKNFFADMSIVGKDFERLAWRGIVAIDILEKALRRIRPYEVEKGETERVYQQYVRRVAEAIKNRGNLSRLMEEAAKSFSRIERSNGRRPVIGLVGEFFVRSHSFSNEDIVKKLEALGLEVWSAPVNEWFLYRNFRRNMHSKIFGDWSSLLETTIKNWVQVKDEHKLSHPFCGSLETINEPSTDKILALAEPYIHKTFEGEAIMSIGKACDFIERGVSGLVNAIPFTCMPGTIAQVVLKKVSEDYGNIPHLTIAYDGLSQANTQIRLETFAHQAKERKERQG
ncbi:MAG: acyl-CoA dehydratase activase [bacterium]